MKKRAGLAVITLLLAVAVIVSGSVLVLRVFYTWSLVLFLGYLALFFTLKGISFNETPLPERAQVGTPIYQQISLANKGRLPKFGIRVHAINDLPRGDISATLDLPARQTAIWKADYDLRHRGRYSLGRFCLSSTDPFGLFHREVAAGSSSEVLIHPPAVSLPSFSLLGLNGSGLSKRMPEALSASASNIREYGAGDSLRHIHWRSTAHTGRYMVKVFDADKSRHRAEDYWVILDMGTSHSGQGDDSTVEYAVTLAASLAKEYIANGYKFGLISAAEDPIVLPSNTGQQHLTDILDFLAEVKPTGSFSFPEMIARNQGLFTSNSTIIIISPTSASSLTESFHQLNSRGCAVAYFLIDGTDFGGSSPAAVGRTLTQLGAPVYLLHRAETFKQALDQAASAVSWFNGANRS